MSVFMRGFRLLPVLLFATASLLALKVGGLVLSGGYTLSTPRSAQADAIKSSRIGWSERVGGMLGVPDVTGNVDKPADKESSGTSGEAPRPAGEAASPPRPDVPSTPADGGRVLSPAERAVLERLQERRQELDQRARELDIRESLLAAAEKRLDARLVEIKEVEARINASLAKKEEAEIARIKSLVTMYENMKAKDAARIFDRLDLKILIDVASQINPRRMSDILAQMNSEAAERLTVELATRNPADRAPSFSDLPKIEGRPGG